MKLQYNNIDVFKRLDHAGISPSTDPESCQPDASVPAPVDAWLVVVVVLDTGAGTEVGGASAVAWGCEGSVTVEL